MRDNRVGLKWTYFDENVLPAWVAEMDFGLAPAIEDALHDAVARGNTGYIYPDLIDETAVAATEYWSSKLGWDVAPSRVFAVPDVVDGIRRAIEQLTKPDSPVVLHSPAYFPFFSMVATTGRDLVEVPSLEGPDGRYEVNLDGIEEAFARGAGSIVLCNPWNPTGQSFTADELRPILDAAASHGARVICDEIHAPLTYPGTEHVPAAALDPETVITVTSASKAWNLPGLKCAQVVLTNDDDVARWSEYFTFERTIGVSTFGLVANKAAYREGQPWLDDVMGILDTNRGVVAEHLEHIPVVNYRPPDATYLAWLDFRPCGLASPTEHCLEYGRVALTDGAPFGEGGAGFARLNFGTSTETLHEIMERIAAAVS